MLRDDYGDASLILSQKRCPACGATLVQLGEEKPSLPIQIISAVRDADLASAEILELAEGVRQAKEDTSPRELSQQFPAATQIFTVASRAGEGWIAKLTLVLTVIGLYLAYAGINQAHRDAQQAHRDAQQAIEQAHEDAKRALRQSQRDADARERSPTTKDLSDEDIRAIAEQIMDDLKRDSAKR